MIALLVVLAVTATVVGLAGRLPEPRKVKRLVGTARIQSIASVADGKAVAIRGDVALTSDDAATVAPVSGRPCAFWVVVFDEVSLAGGSRQLGRAFGGSPFVLRDATATARIIPDDPRIAVAPVERVEPAPFAGALGTLANEVCRPLEHPRTGRRRATEYAVMPGMTITVLGWCTRETDPEAAGNVSGYREALPTRAVISGTRRRRVLIG